MLADFCNAREGNDDYHYNAPLLFIDILRLVYCMIQIETKSACLKFLARLVLSHPPHNDPLEDFQWDTAPDGIPSEIRKVVASSMALADFMTKSYVRVR